jgi:hypothetical protein
MKTMAVPRAPTKPAATNFRSSPLNTPQIEVSGFGGSCALVLADLELRLDILILPVLWVC